MTIVGGAPLTAQASIQVRIADTAGVAVPFALLEANLGGRRIADSLGRASLELPQRADSILVTVRRIGYQPTSAVLRQGNAPTLIVLTPVARSLSAIVISERRNNLLVARGFYDRFDRVRAGAYTGEFITPEDLERISPSRPSQAFRGSQYVSIQRTGPRQVATLLGRGRCGYTILVDGVRVRTLEENAAGTTSINSRGTARQREDTSIDELVNGLEIAAIEVYPSAATAPAEIQARAMGGRGSCGIVAIWTGRGG